jgi:hypothetical protein
MSCNDVDGEGSADSTPRRPKSNAFVKLERQRQVAYLDSMHPGRVRYRGSEYRFASAEKASNLAPTIREVAMDYFHG